MVSWCAGGKIASGERRGRGKTRDRMREKGIEFEENDHFLYYTICRCRLKGKSYDGITTVENAKCM